MKSLFKERDIATKKVESPWNSREIDRLLDTYLAGASPAQMALKMQRTPKAIARLLEKFSYNERDTVVRYEPVHRLNRQGNRWTTNERKLVRDLAARGVGALHIARVLARSAKELGGDDDKLKDRKVESLHKELASNLKLPVSSDILQAHQYLYHCAKEPVISDAAYDALKAEEFEYGAWDMNMPARKKVVEYPPHIRDFAFYISHKANESGDEKKTYAIAERTGPKEYQFWYGPVASLKEVLSIDGKSDQSRILVLHHKERRRLFRWRDGDWMRLKGSIK